MQKFHADQGFLMAIALADSLPQCHELDPFTARFAFSDLAFVVFKPEILSSSFDPNLRTELKNSLSNPKIFLTLKFPFKPLLRRHFIFTLEPSSFLRRPSSSSSLEPSLIFIFWNPTLHRTQKTLTSITPPSISLVRRCVSQLATPFAVLLAVLVVVLLATLCRGSARLSLSRFCSPLPVVKYCSENNKRLIHFSTCEVYGKTIGSFLPKDSYASVDWRLWLSLL
ncbi:UDP-D-apiose/UDP-D-xylose synthase [Arachis hypogaea]|nr:UDP-D-apiose/UDP-D-xylose synthase [Arachis hypogaea]